MDTTIETPIWRIIDGVEKEVMDTIATEIAFTLLVNGEVMVSLMCSPAELDAMAVGFLLSEGILSSREELISVDVDEDNSRVSVKLRDKPEGWDKMFHRKTITSGCGQGVTFTDAATLKPLSHRRAPIKTSSRKIGEMLRDFARSSELYQKTGGVHSAALTDGESILLFSEDIGRHNAVDKLIGKAFLSGISLEDKILLSSGRISGEIMTKVIRNRIPILITRTAPTCMSLNHAEENGVTMIGFARGRRLNIYTHPLKILLDDVVAESASVSEPD